MKRKLTILALGLIALVTAACSPYDTMGALSKAGSHCYRYEDGSGSCTDPVDHRKTAIKWPAGTFAWNCATDGNRVCG